MKKFIVQTCNVRGLRDKNKRRQFFRYVHEKKIDICLVQETHATKSVQRRWRNEFGGKMLFANGENNAKGVAIMINRNFDCKISDIEKSMKGRWIIVKITVNKISLNICCMYSPNDDDVEFFMDLTGRLIEKESDHTIWGGDFNKVLNEEMDRKGLNKIIYKSSAYLNEFLEQNNWSDIWRLEHMEDRQFTWHKSRLISMSRLDYFLIPDGTIDIVDYCEIKPGYLSDHEFVQMKIKLEDQVTGRGYWKLNNSILRSEKYVEQMNEIIVNISKKKMNDIYKNGNI